MPQNMRSVKLQRAAIQQLFDAQGRPTNIVDRSPGEVIQLPADEAARYIERGYATALDNK